MFKLILPLQICIYHNFETFSFKMFILQYSEIQGRRTDQQRNISRYQTDYIKCHIPTTSWGSMWVVVSNQILLSLIPRLYQVRHFYQLLRHSRSMWVMSNQSNIITPDPPIISSVHSYHSLRKYVSCVQSIKYYCPWSPNYIKCPFLPLLEEICEYKCSVQSIKYYHPWLH